MSRVPHSPPGLWGRFCIGGNINPTCPSIEELLAYLTHMYEDGMQYNTIASTKNALANVLVLPGSLHFSDTEIPEGCF